MPRPRREFSLAERAWRRTLRLIRRGTSSLRVLPDFLIVGAQKSGTSSLHAYLEEHSQLVAPPDRKELHFFDRHFGAGVGHYRSYFPTSLGRRLRAAVKGGPVLCFETTPEYMVFAEARERIHALLGSIPLVLILRDPIDRAWSAYRMYSTDNVDAEFEELLDADASIAQHEGRELDPAARALTQEMDELRLFTRGLYVEQLLALFELWPRDEILVLDFEDLKRDPKGTTARVLERLGLSPLEREAWPIHNASTGDALPQGLRARLASYYEGPDKELAALLGWTPAWMKPE